ncbi:MAG: circularly permuted type 2 ATP-grasp protein [Planctomycetales bacterium]|nr:circularly permuted type 2 ATP-grasp protein [Planctomycetales bacterium]
MNLGSYSINGSYDELFESAERPRARSAPFVERLLSLADGELQRRQRAADNSLYEMGITFAVYGHEAGTEKVWPVDLVPRIIDAEEWGVIERGLVQRVRALNLFIGDLYNEQRILQDGVVPRELIDSAKTLRPQCVGQRPPCDVWCHISGVDLVRDKDGTIYVLEDNLRCPSGVSYVLENREVMKRTFSRLFQGMSVATVESYPERLLETLLDCAPTGVADPTAVLLTPGIYNSAYFEHSFLAQQMGVELVQGTDLVVVDDHVFMKTTHGLKRVDVIYRRIDDDFLDPRTFRADSALGVPGLMDVYRSGRVTLANAPGTGVADDKAVYAYVPDIIRYYLTEEPVLNNVPTFLCSDEKQREHVIANIDKLVVKPTNESGGYGILMGPQATPAEREQCAEAIRGNPRNYIAQPMLDLSTVPTIVGDTLQPRHVDLRPFVLCGKDIYVLPGGLTRVALREGSMVVNSSQGGGSKDTWVLTRDGREQSKDTTHDNNAGRSNAGGAVSC